MYPATLIQWCRGVTAAPGSNFAEMVQPIQLVDGIASTSAPGSIIANGFNKLPAKPGGGATLSLYSNGTAYSDGDTSWNWWTPTTAGIGSGYWAELIPGSGIGIISGSALNSRVSLSATVSWVLSASGRDRLCTLNFYDAETGGTLLSSGSVEFNTEI